MTTTPLLLVATKAVTLILGGLITYLSYRAYRRQHARALRALTVGFGLVTAGATAGGVLYHLGGTSLPLSVTVDSIVTAAGFTVLVYSLYVEKGSGRVSGADHTPRETGRHGAD